MTSSQDKTLIIGPSWVGDMVMAQGLFKAIKINYPQTQIEVLAPEWSRPLTARMPEISQSITMPLKHGELELLTRYRLGKQLKAAGYQRCFVLPNSFKSALIPFWANIAERIGWRGEWRYGLINQLRVLDKQRYPLMIQRYIALGFSPDATLPQLRPELQVEENSILQALSQYHLNKEKPILVFCPGAEFGPSKRWPAKAYAKLANHYLKQDWQIWIMGSAKDAEVAQVIQQDTQNGCIDLTGKTSLGEAIDLMSLAKTVVTNDSGLMHIAAALSRPLVALYGSTSPQFTPPLADNAAILQEKISCSPCFKRICPLGHHQCMESLSVEKVIQAIENINC